MKTWIVLGVLFLLVAFGASAPAHTTGTYAVYSVLMLCGSNLLLCAI